MGKHFSSFSPTNDEEKSFLKDLNLVVNFTLSILKLS